MSFFKSSDYPPSSRAMAWLHRTIWMLIFGGLLVGVLGIAVQRSDELLGWAMVLAGAVLVLAGALLVYARSRIPDR
jgi:sulfite exporter TauE/SafE